jgi:exonuclease III
MKLAAWNVNSLKARLPHLIEWLARERMRYATPNASIARAAQ